MEMHSMLWLYFLNLGFDICENCSIKGGHDFHGVVMIHHCQFPIYHKYQWTGKISFNIN